MRVRYPISSRKVFTFLAVGWVTLLFLGPIVSLALFKLGLSIPVPLPGLN